ncbi:neural cell adhesion molecule 1-like [Sinocyclocheilus anshuiensis]|uniref:neural cell adhesion molecule 1-like n=1 Tax=Sinocyclocheilus anshuiensis TaxID=1608454 RepID=UPI0007B849CD|nr:PREDICTED: neural cell adhesion molecule 1-like [Sinocyclocheilus anshuiensis]
MFPTKAIILVLLFFGNAVSLQVDITPAQGEISVGESRFFLCEVIGGAKEIDWFAPTGEKIEPGRLDVSVIRNDETSSTLTIYNAKVDNAGTYKCVASSGDREAEATVNLKIYQKITFTNVPSPQEFTEGDNAIIVCDVISSPPPTVLWKYKGAKIQFEKDVRFRTLNNNHLQIRGIRKTDEGVYTCEGRIKARGEVDFRSIKVVVNVLPTIRIRQAETNGTADMGFSTLLACDADGFPEPMVTWARDHHCGQESHDFKIVCTKTTNRGANRSRMKVSHVNNVLLISINVLSVKPKITYLESQTTTEMDEQVTLTCEATGDPTPTITWSFGTRVFTEGEQEHQKWIYQASWTRPEQHKNPDGDVLVRSDARVSSLTLKYAQYTDAGEYLCTARNAIGEMAQPVYLEVRYAPKILGSVTVYTWEGNPANISCEVLAHPSNVSITWLRDGVQLPNANISNIKIYNTPSANYLEVNPESQSDFGNYNCTASNEIGTESKEFIVIPADVPSAPSITQVQPYSSTAQVLFEEPESTGGVPVLKYRAEWRAVGRGKWVQRVYEVQDGLSSVTVTGLKPETDYEVKMSAINGKGEGDGSQSLVFKTEHVQYSYTNGIFHFHTEDTEGEPSSPILEGTLQPKGNSLKVKWTKQDDGGSPITHYLVKYKAREDSDWKPEIRLPNVSEYVMLIGLEWDTEYDVFVVAENQQGKSKPGTLTFRTSSEPAATTDSMEDGTGLNTGVIVGILILVCMLLLLIVDATCCFLNKCGILMCICGKPGQGTKGKDIETGKAAFVQDVSKEPIVEVRTEEEATANHDAEGHPEPNETTPLTEPEQVTETAAAVVDLPLSVPTNSDTVTDLSQSSPVSESTTLTSSITAPPSDSPNPIHTTPPNSSTPKSHTKPSSSSPPSSDPANVTLLVDLGDSPEPQTEVPPVVPSEEPVPVPPPSPFSADQPAAINSKITENELESPESHATLNPISPQGSVAIPLVNHEHEIDGELPLAPDTDVPQDGSHAVGTAGSSGPSVQAQDEKILDDEKSTTENADLKKVVPGTGAEPNALTQTNATESKA